MGWREAGPATLMRAVVGRGPRETLAEVECDKCLLWLLPCQQPLLNLRKMLAASPLGSCTSATTAATLHYPYLAAPPHLLLAAGTKDFLVDCLALPRQDVRQLLAPVLSNPRICKVVHGGGNDVAWLHRDFGLVLTNVFDTEKACQVGRWEGLTCMHLCAILVCRPPVPSHVCMAHSMTLRAQGMKRQSVVFQLSAKCTQHLPSLPYLCLFIRRFWAFSSARLGCCCSVSVE